MEVKVISKERNPLLKRMELHFQVDHTEAGGTPPRLEIRKAVAAALKTDVNFVFVKELKTKTGTHIAVGKANVYESADQARLVEPEYVVTRNVPPEKPAEEAKQEKKE